MLPTAAKRVENLQMSAAKHLEYMQKCIDDAERRSGAERAELLRMAKAFEAGAIQIERSLRLLAESKAALAFADGIITPTALPAGWLMPPRPSRDWRSPA